MFGSGGCSNEGCSLTIAIICAPTGRQQIATKSARGWQSLATAGNAIRSAIAVNSFASTKIGEVKSRFLSPARLPIPPLSQNKPAQHFVPFRTGRKNGSYVDCMSKTSKTARFPGRSRDLRCSSSSEYADHSNGTSLISQSVPLLPANAHYAGDDLRRCRWLGGVSVELDSSA